MFGAQVLLRFVIARVAAKPDKNNGERSLTPRLFYVKRAAGSFAFVLFYCFYCQSGGLKPRPALHTSFSIGGAKRSAMDLKRINP